MTQKTLDPRAPPASPESGPDTPLPRSPPPPCSFNLQEKSQLRARKASVPWSSSDPSRGRLPPPPQHSARPQSYALDTNLPGNFTSEKTTVVDERRTAFNGSQYAHPALPLTHDGRQETDGSKSQRSPATTVYHSLPSRTPRHAARAARRTPDPRSLSGMDRPAPPTMPTPTRANGSTSFASGLAEAASHVWGGGVRRLWAKKRADDAEQ